MKKTPWFEGDVRPHWPGVYERDMSNFGNVGRYSYWNGTHWCGWGGTVGTADLNGQHRHRSSVQYARWRGLVRRATSTRGSK